MFDTLQKLCTLNGISGREDAVRSEIIRQIKPYCTCQTDHLGNLIAFKIGKQRPKNKVLLSAHMDEVGMIITGITSDGMLRFTTVGGIDARVIIGRSVMVGEDTIGVIGTKAVHMQDADERGKAMPVDKLYIDIGAQDEEQAKKTVMLGESVTFNSAYVAFGSDKIKAKAIDDRFGCAVMIELIKQDLAYDTYFSFVTQEEVGLRGAKVAAFGVNPDMAIILEATTASDLTGVDEVNQVCKLGKGAAVPFMDRATIYNHELYKLAFATAQENGIPCQTKTVVAGGNDAGAIATSGNGTKVISISVPCRYLHSPSCVIDKNDGQAVYDLAKLLLDKLAVL